MANYDRRILVPYLQDVCTTEMLCAKLIREVRVCRDEINQLNAQINRKIIDPSYPDMHVADNTNNYVGTFIFVVLPLLIGIFLLSKIGTEAIAALVIAIIVAVVLGSPWVLGIFEENDKVDKLNKESLEKHKKQLAHNKQLRDQIPAKRRLLSEKQVYLKILEQNLREARKLRDEVYGVNIIANKYRSIHVAYYLYDYFSTSRETDLDKIIQTLLLDEIVQRLDKIIAQNETIILNQRMQMAMQEEQNRIAAVQHREQLQAFARMEQDLELQADYQHMIAKNQMVTNFLLAADYMQKYR